MACSRYTVQQDTTDNRERKRVHRLETRFVRIAEHGSRVLRVVVNKSVVPLRLDDSRIIESREVSPGVVLDFNERNQVVGVEILNLSQRAPSLNCRELQFQTA